MILAILSLDSCKRLGDYDGNLLNDMGANQGGLTGKRFLYQEVTAGDTLAEYHYASTKLTEMIGDGGITKIIYNGEMLNKITYNGIVDGDSIAYVQTFNYDLTGTVINSITENRTVYEDFLTPPAPPATIPIKKYKSIYELKYSPTTKKLTSIMMRKGEDKPNIPFAYTMYEETKYTYDSKFNVTTATIDVGGYTGGVFGPAISQVVYTFAEYDSMKNPYSNLLPFGYIVSKSLEDPWRSYWFSVNNPEKLSVFTEGMPTPMVVTTQYTYDPQAYPLSGYGINYDYRPF